MWRSGMLAEMRIALFRKLDSLAPAFMLKRRSGDVVNLATYDIEMIEYFFAHTIAPVFVAGVGTDPGTGIAVCV